MKIGFFTETFYPQVNGVVKSIEAFGRELVKRGHEVHVFAPKPDRTEHEGMIIHSSPAITFKPYPDYKIAIPINVKVPKLDIVHTHGPFSMGVFGLKIAKKQNIPKISTFHTLLSEYTDYVSRYGKKFTSKIAWDYLNYHYNKYDKIITPSKAIKNQLPVKIRKKTIVIPTGIDTSFLKPVKKAKEKLGLQDKKVFLYLGRISYEKKINILLKAGDLFLEEESILIIAGKGPALKELMKEKNKMKNKKKVKFVGFVKEEEKPLYYSAADLFLTASASETQGIVITEAMACGTPVIAADAFASPEMIDEGVNGYLFSPGNYKELARIIKFHRFPKSMSRNARKRAEKISIKNTTDKLEDLYYSLSKRRV